LERKKGLVDPEKELYKTLSDL